MNLEIRIHDGPVRQWHTSLLELVTRKPGMRVRVTRAEAHEPNLAYMSLLLF